jgi:hypothetical protein
MQSCLTVFLIQFFLHNPKLIWIFSVVSIGMWTLSGYNSYRELSTMPLQPEQLSMEEVAAKMQDGRVWVSINNAEWDCENSLHRFKEFGSGNYRTYLVFTNPDQTIVGVVTSHTGKSYGESTNDVPTGVVSPMNEKMKAAFQKKGIDFSRYPNAHVYLDLCGFCGRRNSSLLLTCSPLMLLLSLALPFLVNSGSEKRKRGIIVYG